MLNWQDILFSRAVDKKDRQDLAYYFVCAWIALELLEK